jgi:hypothetical protein
MESISQPIEVNEVDLGDDTITASLFTGVVGSGNTSYQPLTMGTPFTDPLTLGTPPADPLTLGIPPYEAVVAIMHRKRSKTKRFLKFGMTFFAIEVGGVKKSYCN